jgi:hypothetical protein
MVALLRFAVVEVQEMPMKAPHVTGMDLVRARDIVRSLAPLEGLSGADAESVAKAIAQCFAKGREQGLQQLKDALTNNASIAPVLGRWLGPTSKEETA